MYMKNKKFGWCVAGLAVAMVMCSCGKFTDSVSNKNEEVVEEKQSEGKKEETVSEVKNSYFFDASQENPTYTVNAFLEEDVDEVNMKVEQVATYDNGDVYPINIQYVDCPGRYYYDVTDRFNLGFFYVTDSKIIMIREQGDVPTEDEFISDGILVCDTEDSTTNNDGEEVEITNEDGTCRCSIYNTLIESGFYSTFVWTEGKGLTCFRSGYGAEGEPIELVLQDYRDIKSISLLDLYDFDDDSSLENGMYTQVTDEASEEEFLSYFYNDDSQYEMIEDAGAEVYVGKVEDKNVFVSLVSNSKSEYPKEAYGFKYSPSDAVKEAKYIPYQEGIEVLDGIKSIDGKEYQYIDEIKPLLDYQEKEYIREDGKIVKVEYSSDSEEYGTYNSSGTLYYDSQERPFYKSYYVTSGSKYMFYLYDEEGNLMQIFDFGGMSYKSLEENPDIEIGVDFKTYIFER